MVCLEVVDLLAEEECPEVFAEEFYALKGRGGGGAEGGESVANVSMGMVRARGAHSIASIESTGVFMSISTRSLNSKRTHEDTLERQSCQR